MTDAATLAEIRGHLEAALDLAGEVFAPSFAAKLRDAIDDLEFLQAIANAEARP